MNRSALWIIILGLMACGVAITALIATWSKPPVEPEPPALEISLATDEDVRFQATIRRLTRSADSSVVAQAARELAQEGSIRSLPWLLRVLERDVGFERWLANTEDSNLEEWSRQTGGYGLWARELIERLGVEAIPAFAGIGTIDEAATWATMLEVTRGSSAALRAHLAPRVLRFLRDAPRPDAPTLRSVRRMAHRWIAEFAREHLWVFATGIEAVEFGALSSICEVPEVYSAVRRALRVEREAFDVIDRLLARPTDRSRILVAGRLRVMGPTERTRTLFALRIGRADLLGRVATGGSGAVQGVRLARGSRTTSTEAIRLWNEVGPLDPSVLVPSLGDSSSDVRHEAIHALFAGTKPLLDLAGHFESLDAPARGRLLAELERDSGVRITARVHDIAFDLVTHAAPAIRSQAFRFLAARGPWNDRMATLLAEKLSDDDPEIRALTWDVIQSRYFDIEPPAVIIAAIESLDVVPEAAESLLALAAAPEPWGRVTDLRRSAAAIEQAVRTRGRVSGAWRPWVRFVAEEFAPSMFTPAARREIERSLYRIEEVMATDTLDTDASADAAERAKEIEQFLDRCSSRGFLAVRSPRYRSRLAVIGHLAEDASPSGREHALRVLREAAGSNDESAERRAAALEALGHLADDPAIDVPILMQALDVWDPEVRDAAARALGEFGVDAASAFEALRAELDAVHPGPRAAACFAVGRMGAIAYEVGPVLVERLSDASRFVRREAARAIGELGPLALDAFPSEDERHPLDALLRALNDRDPSVRRSAVLALGQLATPRRDVIAALSKARDAVDPSIVRMAETALRRLGVVVVDRRLGFESTAEFNRR